MSQGIRNGLQHTVIDPFSVAEAQLHLGRMDIYIQRLGIDGKMKHGKGIFMLHHKGLIGFLNGLCHNAAFNISSIDKIIFIIAVGSCNYRLSDIAKGTDPVSFCFYLEKVGCDLPAEYGVDQILQIVIAGGVKLVLIVLDKANGYVRMGKGNFFHQGCYMCSLCHRGF